MARERSEKSKNKPLDKPDGRKGKVRTGRTGKSDEGVSTSAEPTGEVTSGNPTRHYSVQPAARSQKRQERQRIEEPSGDLRESKKFLEQTPRTTRTNGLFLLFSERSRAISAPRAFPLLVDEIHHSRPLITVRFATRATA